MISILYFIDYNQLLKFILFSLKYYAFLFRIELSMQLNAKI